MSMSCNLQIFKWEERKAWDVLLTAYLEEFAGDSAVSVTGAHAPIALYLLTQPYHSSSAFASKMHAWAHSVLGITGERHFCALRRSATLATADHIPAASHADCNMH
jgi:hypothetical protein